MADQAKTEHFNAIRRIYDSMMPAIMREPNGIDPYFADWSMNFTYIERMAWSAIRANGLPLYPQLPIGPFFADFADPHKRIVVECDGAEFHKDIERDRDRDAWMDKRGWVVYRITGRECCEDEIDWEEIDDLERDGEIEEASLRILFWLRRTSDGIVRAIAAKHYGRPFKRIASHEVDLALSSHRREFVR